MAGQVERVIRHVRRRYRRLTQPRRGADLCVDLGRVLTPLTIFDVGANIGQSAATFRRRFPRARIHCFEPAAASAARLRARGLANVEVHEMALGSRGGTALLACGRDPAAYRISDDGVAPVRVETLDAFCADRGVSRIDLLKIDTEGHDLEVLKGAAAMIAAGRVSAFQVEAGLNPDNQLHVPFEVLKAFAEAHGFRLYGVYDQVSEWPTRQPHLRRANPVFVSREVYDRPPR